MAAAKRQPKTEPSTNGARDRSNGRDKNGRFAVGNPGGPGNPFAKDVAEWRSVFSSEVSLADKRRIVRALKKKAEEGNLVAIGMMLNRFMGRESTADVLDRLEALEARFGKGIKL